MRIQALSGRLLIYLALVVALGLSILPISRAPKPPDANYFAETGFTVSGRFLEVWMGTHTYQDGVAINGYPISDAHDEVNPADGKTYRVQWFERARFELHPDQAPPNDVQLGLLGKDAVWNTRRNEPPFQPVAQPAGVGATLMWIPETRHTIRGAFLTFWNRYGGTQQFGCALHLVDRGAMHQASDEALGIRLCRRQSREVVQGDTRRQGALGDQLGDQKSTRLNSSHT